MKKTYLLLGLILILSGSMEAANWPEWRGPHRTGVSPEKGLPAEWTNKSNIAWKAQLGGLGVSSPIIWGDRVFVTYQVGASALRPGRHPTFVQGSDPTAAGELPLGGTRIEGSSGTQVTFVVAAFRTTDGKLLWEHKFDAEGELPAVHEKSNLASPSPATDGERVYAWFSNGQLAVLDLDGKPVWMRHLGREYGPFEISWGHASSPVVYRDRLLLACYHEASSFLLALDKRSGKEVWRVEREKGLRSYSTPLVIETGKGGEVVVNASEGVEAFDAETGKQLWQFREANRFPIPMPVFVDGTLYLSRGYRSGPYMAIRSGGRGDIAKADLLWHTETGAPYVSSLIHQDGLIYMATELGIFTCIDAKTGERIWRERLGGLFSASPVAADGKIYFLSETGEMIVLKPGRTPEVLARNKLDEQCIASPAIAHGKIFIRTARHLIAVGNGSH